MTSPETKTTEMAQQMAALAVKGKTYTLFKRDPATGEPKAEGTAGWKDLPYYFRFKYRGKPYLRNTQTNVADTAQSEASKLARAIIAGVLTDENAALDHTKMRASVSATVGELKASYLTSPVQAKESTRIQNKHALDLLLERVLGVKPEAVDKLPLTCVNRNLRDEWFALAATRSAKKSQRESASIQRSANSRFNHACGLLTPKALAHYKKHGLVVPRCAEEFATNAAAARITHIPRQDYNPPSDAILEATLKSWQEMENRNLFLAVGQVLSFGLRKGEVGQSMWGWFTVRSGYPVIDSTNVDDDVFVKNGSGIVQVRALDPFYTIMMDKARARGWVGKPGDYIISGHMTNREDDIYREVGHWMRALGWKTQKTNHALRAYSGSQIAMKYGIYEASVWLRHASVKVTEKHYTAYVKRFRPEDPDALPAHWASAATAAPALRVIETAAAAGA